MNMISTGAFLNEMDASNKQPSVAEKFAAVWEKKNAKAARAGGVSLMALSLAACGSSSTTTSTSTTTTTTTTTPTASTMELTIASDAGTSFTGTAANDTFDGGLDGGVQTLNSSDVLDGGAGTDTLNAVIAGTGTYTPTLTSIEDVNILMTAAGTVALTNATSLANLKVYSSTANTTVNNITTNAAITIEDVVNTTARFDFKADALGGAGKAITLNTDGSTTTVDINVSGKDTITSATIDSSGVKSSLTIDALDAVKTLTITGDAALTLAGTDAFTAMTTIDASGFSGGLTMDLDDNAKDYTITGGAGKDLLTIDTDSSAGKGRTVNLGAGDDTATIHLLDADDVITGGDGTDSLEILDETDITLALTAGVSGFERLVASESGATYALSDYTNATEFTIVKANAASVTFTTAGSNVTTLEINSAVDTLASFARQTDGTADTLTVKVTGTAASDLDTLSIATEETVTIDVNAADIGTTAQTVAVTSTDLKTLTIVGDNDVYLGATSGSALTALDLSGHTAGDFKIDMSASTAGITMTVGSAPTGAYTITGGLGDDTLIGTAQADVIVGNTGADTVTLGGGADTYTLDGNGMDTITDFTVGASGDTLKIDASDFGTVIDGDGAVHGGTNDLELVTSAETLSATDNIIVLSGTAFATAALAGAAMESGGSRQITGSAAAISDNDVILFVYSDGTDAYLAKGVVDNAASATTIDSGGLTETNILKFAGLSETDIASMVTANFDLI